MPAAGDPISPVLTAKDHASPSVFQPAALLREARRQRGLPELAVPAACVLDPDGDILDHLVRAGATRPHPGWACYHTALAVCDLPGLATPVGVIGRAVGAPFAVLLAEQLFASGCRLLVSLTSAGRIATDAPPGPHYILIDRALRDEGTSQHYLPPARFALAPDGALLLRIAAAMRDEAPGLVLRQGATWTTDAPYRETAGAIAAARDAGCLAVEMEAAALLAFATAAARPVVCIAQVTNAMAQTQGDFEKGEASGAVAALRLLSIAIRAAGIA